MGLFSSPKNADKLFDVAEAAHEKGNYRKAAELYGKAADLGHVLSMIYLAYSYRFGEGVPEDAKEALKWYQKAYRSGYRKAAGSIGAMYHYEEICGADNDEIEELLLEGAAYDNDKTYIANRHYKLMSIKPDGSELKLHLSAAMDTQCDTVLHPKRLAKALMENVGPFPPQSQMYTQDIDMQQSMIEVWDYVMDWYTKTFDYMIENEGIQMIFSHMHSVDFVEHTFIRHMKNIGFNQHPEEMYASWMERLYDQIDRYVGSMMHYLDEGWTIIVTADHAQVAPSHIPPAIGDMCGVNAGLMRELGYTVLKKDENGNDIGKIDWSKTRAIASQGNDIFINLKGREKHGIVEPEDKYELEEQIMTDLYNYKHPDTGKRVIAMALRNKDAILLGYGGPTAGDICIWVAEGYNYDHTDSLSTTYGEGSTSSSPIFIAAGKGLKKGFETTRIIRQVDLAPTCCVMAGVRLPHECEGAPIYQIFEEEF